MKLRSSEHMVFLCDANAQTANSSEGGCRCVHVLGTGNLPLRTTYIEPCLEKNRIFTYAKTKAQISFAVAAKLISAFVFATRIVQFLYFLNPKFTASSHLLCYSRLCVGPGRKPRRPVSARHGSDDL